MSIIIQVAAGVQAGVTRWRECHRVGGCEYRPESVACCRLVRNVVWCRHTSSESLSRVFPSFYIRLFFIAIRVFFRKSVTSEFILKLFYVSRYLSFNEIFARTCGSPGSAAMLECSLLHDNFYTLHTFNDPILSNTSKKIIFLYLVPNCSNPII